VVVKLGYTVLKQGSMCGYVSEEVVEENVWSSGMEKIENENIVIDTLNRYLEDCQMKLN
jgi:hypothetical protein